jgi:hypothetical protein
MLAPIALFAYNRPRHFRWTINALLRNPLAEQSELYVFLDGPKSDTDASSVAAVREQVRDISGFRSVHIVENNTNLGLSRSIVGGVTEVLGSRQQVIVLEDDMVTSPYFLEYMNEALTLYREDHNVASIHGFMYNIAGLPETFFMKGADCWGWATWRRAWQAFTSDGEKLLGELERRGLVNDFNLDGAYANTQMLRDQVAGLNDSWAIRWHASAFLREMLTLHPGRTLVCNIGLDGSGTHCNESQSHLMAEPSMLAVKVNRQTVVEDSVAATKFAQHLRSSLGPDAAPKSISDRLISNLKSLLPSRVS